MWTILPTSNTTDDAAVDYKGMDCHDKFTIDKTLPVIHVHYNPADESGLHNGVLFYNKEQHVTVTIEELNFRAQDVYAEFKQGGVPSAHALSNFDSEGINHRAYVAFGEGNKLWLAMKSTPQRSNLCWIPLLP